MITSISQYRPAGHKIVVKFVEEKTTSGLVLPASAKPSKRPGWFGRVVAISPGADLKDAGCPDLKVGDLIDTDCIFSACRQIEICSDLYVLINDGDICGIVEEA
jgi:co-chaperonin GroES (HSP10)